MGIMRAETEKRLEFCECLFFFSITVLLGKIRRLDLDCPVRSPVMYWLMCLGLTLLNLDLRLVIVCFLYGFFS